MLTILIPSYNHEKYILECLGAAIDVDIFGKKIIVIDDGSTDSTPDLVANFIEKNKQHDITLVQKQNSGLVSSLNLGLSLIQTEFMYLVASDDIPTSSGIKECCNLLASNSELKFIMGGGVNLFDDDKKTAIYGKKHDLFFELPVKKQFQQMFLNYPSPLLLQATIFRVSALKEIGGWDATLKLDDYPTFVKLLGKFSVKGVDYEFFPTISVVEYRHHGVNTYKNIEKQFGMVKQAMDKLAPASLRDHAIGNALGYYLLISLRDKNFKLIYKLFRERNGREILFAVRKMAGLIINKIVSLKT